jgi:hypothetical protein|tara:strand:+ start:527 stop:739 length:213 start_codon:yes stop_codon:yes gene_type:complete
MLLQGMMLKKVLGKLLPLVLGELQGSIKPLQDYVYKPNDADKRIDKLEIDNFQLRERLNELEKNIYNKEK